MNKGITGVVTALAVVALCGAAGPAHATDGTGPSRWGGGVAANHATTPSWQGRMLAGVNATRADLGVPLLVLCPSLSASAQGYASTMARTDTFTHIAQDGSGPGERLTAVGYRWRAAGENIAGGQRTVYEVMQAWRSSPSHYVTMTNPAYTNVGFGFAQASGTTYGTYWVQDYGDGRC